MAEFFELSSSDRLEALEYAANMSGRPAHLLEKDVWVVWVLRHILTAPYASHLVFKGGTSLSKAYGVIQRFSEDIDLTMTFEPLRPISPAKQTTHSPPASLKKKDGVKRSAPA